MLLRDLGKGFKRDVLKFQILGCIQLSRDCGGSVGQLSFDLAEVVCSQV